MSLRRGTVGGGSSESGAGVATDRADRQHPFPEVSKDIRATRGGMVPDRTFHEQFPRLRADFHPKPQL